VSPIALTTLVTVLTVAGSIVGGVSAYLLRRRSASGRVSTSEATILWAQAQEMRAMLFAEKEQAEAQRDRLIESHTTQMLPMLTAINETLRQTSLTLATVLDRLDERPP
jgi:hypothetical protein